MNTYIYTGEFFNDKKEGQGKLTKGNGQLFYKGGFAAGFYHGEGKLVYKDGRYCVGNFVDGDEHGKCKIYDDGDRVCF